MNTTKFYHSAETIAHHYRPGTRPESGYFKVPCPAHGGTDNNLHLADAPDGGLIMRCWSTGCTYNEVLAAFQVDGLAIERNHRYSNGKTVTRIDRPGLPKKISSEGTTKGVPLLITNDSPDALIVITEGESDRDAVLSANLPNVAAACFVGGAKMAGDAKYSKVNGRRVAIWPDHDDEGATALLKAVLACRAAGAAEIYAVPYVGDPGSKQGAADLTPDMVATFLGNLREWEPAPVAQLVWTPLADILATPPAHWLVEGLLAAGSVNLMYGAPKAGKTMFILGLLKAASSGVNFLGFPLQQMSSWLISEQSENSLAPQLRTLRIGEDEDIRVALWRHQPEYDSPEAFADAVYDEFCQAKRRPSIIVIDTLSTFIDLKDSNDYSQVQTQLAPIIQMGQTIGAMEGTATLLTHHSRKSGGDGSDSVLGSRRVAAIVDTLLKLTISSRGDGRRKLSIQSRFGLGEVGDELEIMLELPAGEYRMINTGADLDGEIIVAIEGGASSNADIRERLDTGEQDPPLSKWFLNGSQDWFTTT